MNKRLFLDLTKCDECDKCEVECAYFYRARPTDHGVLSLRELATFALVCRRCEYSSCITACPRDALARRDDGIMERYNMRCVSCKSCSLACPFGTIYPEILSFYTTNCDFCSGTGKIPPCVTSCKKNAIEYKEVVESPKDNIYVLSDWLAVHAPKWQKAEV